MENATLREEIGSGSDELRQEIEILRKEKEEAVMRLSLQLSEKEAVIDELLRARSSVSQSPIPARHSPVSARVPTSPNHQPTGLVHQPPAHIQSPTLQAPSPFFQYKSFTSSSEETVPSEAVWKAYFLLYQRKPNAVQHAKIVHTLIHISICFELPGYASHYWL